MIDEQKAIEVSKRFSAYHAHQVLSVSLENNGKLTAYRVRFGSTDEFPHVDIYVDAETAEVLEMRHYDLQTFEQSDVLEEKTDIDNSVKEKIANLLSEGLRLDALKMWRCHFGGTLEEAKRAIESLDPT